MAASQQQHLLLQAQRQLPLPLLLLLSQPTRRHQAMAHTQLQTSQHQLLPLLLVRVAQVLTEAWARDMVAWVTALARQQLLPSPIPLRQALRTIPLWAGMALRTMARQLQAQVVTVLQVQQVLVLRQPTSRAMVPLLFPLLRPTAQQPQLEAMARQQLQQQRRRQQPAALLLPLLVRLPVCLRCRMATRCTLPSTRTACMQASILHMVTHMATTTPTTSTTHMDRPSHRWV
jgi:hypothetical protein